MLLRCESLEPPMSQMGQTRTPSVRAARSGFASCGHGTASSLAGRTQAGQRSETNGQPSSAGKSSPDQVCTFLPVVGSIEDGSHQISAH